MSLQSPHSARVLCVKFGPLPFALTGCGSSKRNQDFVINLRYRKPLQGDLKRLGDLQEFLVRKSTESLSPVLL